jgi:general secretion pathway protein G
MVRSRGFGLLDLMVTLVIASILIVISIPAYNMYVDRAKVARAIGDISSISLAIERYRLNNNDQIPAVLAELSALGITIPLDPWGQSYSYLNIRAAGAGVGALRKDGKLNPLNTDFDLYSAGKDKDSKGPLSAKASRDDIIRANDGAFIGLGEDY